MPPHPLIKHWISVLRNEQTPCPVFSKYKNKNLNIVFARILLVEEGIDGLGFY